MYLKKLLALLLSAALALSLLAGCGGESVARSLLALLDGKYANVSVEMDPDLEADLRQALSETENDDEAAIRAALETLLGSTITFRYLGEGQQGDTAFDLIFYAGADPDKAAQSAYSQWNGTFSNLPDDGLYTAALAQVQTENGVWLLVQATVDKAGTVDKPDKDDDDDEPEKPYSVEIKDGTLKSVTVNTSNGLENLFTKQEGEAQEITAARAGGFAGVTIELAAGETYTVNQQLATAFKGTLQGEDETNKATINITGGNGLFQQIENNGRVENITFDVQTKIENTYIISRYTRAGAVAGLNNGTISNCDVTINAGYSITATNESIYVYTGGIAGENKGTISNCHVKGSYSSDSSATADISASYAEYGSCVYAGGIVGFNTGTVDEYCSVSCCKIEAGQNGDYIFAGGIVGRNDYGSTVDCGSAEGCYITATVGTYTFTATDGNPTDYSQGNGSGSAGTKIGRDDNTSYPVGE